MYSSTYFLRLPLRQAAFVLAANIVVGAGSANAQTAVAAAASSDYSMEYVSSAASGSAVSTANYSIISQVQLGGVSLNQASSTNYSVSPLIGTTSGFAAVNNWNLYF